MATLKELVYPFMLFFPFNSTLRYSWYMTRIKTGTTFVTQAASLMERDSIQRTQLGNYYNNVPSRGLFP